MYFVTYLICLMIQTSKNLRWASAAVEVAFRLFLCHCPEVDWIALEPLERHFLIL